MADPDPDRPARKLPPMHQRRAKPKRVKVPEAYAEESAHVGGGTGSRSPKRFRRLRVVQDERPGYFVGVRDVYLESSLCPLAIPGGPEPVVEMMNCGVPVELVVDLIRQAHRWNLPVVYDPPDNMAGLLAPRKNGQQSLF